MSAVGQAANGGNSNYVTKNGYWNPVENNRSDDIFDFSIQDPCIDLRSKMEDVLSSTSAKLTPDNIITQMVAVLDNEDNEVFKLFAKVMQSKDNVGSVQFGVPVIDELIKQYNSLPQNRPNKPWGERPTERSIFGKKRSTWNKIKPKGHAWLRQVRRTPRDIVQLKLLCQLTNYVCSTKFITQDTIPKKALVEEHGKRITTAYTNIAKRMYKGYFEEEYSDMEASMENYLQNVDTPFRKKVYVYICVCTCELAIISSSFFAMKYSTKLSSMQKFNSNAMLSRNRDYSLMQRGKEAKDMSRDLIMSMYIECVKRRFQSVSNVMTDLSDNRVNDALERIIRQSGKKAPPNDTQRRELALDVCCVVVRWGARSCLGQMQSTKSRSGGSGVDISSLLYVLLIPFIILYVLAVGVSNIYVPALNLSGMFRYISGGLRGQISKDQRNAIMKYLYRMHGLPLKMHELDCARMGSKGCFFTVHAPLCVMIMDTVFNKDAFVADVCWHVNTTVRQFKIPQNYDEAMRFVENQPDLAVRCVAKLFGKDTTVDNVKSLITTPNPSALNNATRIIYNACVVVQQYQKTSNVNSNERIYGLLSQSNAAKTLSQKNFQPKRYAKLAPSQLLPNATSTVSGDAPTIIGSSDEKIQALYAAIQRIKNNAPNNP